MRIAIIGGGNVGGALGGAFARTGHEIIYGVRDKNSSKTTQLLKATHGSAVAKEVQEAAEAAPVIVLSTPWPVTESVVLKIAADLKGKVVIDCTNPLKMTPGVGLELALGFSESGAENVARWAPEAHVVKAFNTYGWENLANAHYPNQAELLPLMFVAGDDRNAKNVVSQLAREIGFAPFDIGGLRRSRELEPLALIWIREALAEGRKPGFTWAMLQR